MKKISIILFLICLFIASNTFASNADDSPEASANGYFLALRKSEIKNFSEYMHPEALKNFRSMLLPVAQIAKEKKLETQFLSFFHKIDNIDALVKLSDKDFFIAFYNGLIALNPLIKQTLQNASAVPLGHVTEGELAHVVYRMTLKSENSSSEKISVLTLKKSGTDWRVLLTSDIETMAKNLKQSFMQK